MTARRATVSGHRDIGGSIELVPTDATGAALPPADAAPVGAARDGAVDE